MRRYRVLALIVLLGPAAAGGQNIKPSLALGEIYTNNVDLAPSGEEESAWVTRIAPTLDMRFDGSSLQFVADYTLEALLYAGESDRNEIWNQLSSAAILDLIGKDLQLRGTAVLDQVNMSPSKPTSNSNINTTGNRGDAFTWSVGPQWRRYVLGGSEVDGYATVGRVDFDSPDSQDVKTTSGRFSLHTDPRLDPLVTYELAYEGDKLDYQVSGDTVVQTAYLDLGYRINSTWQLTGLVGLDNDIEDPNDNSLSEGRWQVGFNLSLDKNAVSAAVGHRYFGATYAFSWDRQEPDAAYHASYSETPTTSDLTAINQIPVSPAGTTPPVTPPPNSDINNYGTPTRYIVKRADARGTWTLYRSEFYSNVFWEERTNQIIPGASESTNAGLDNETSYGFDLGFRWEAGPRSVASIAAAWRDRKYNDLSSSGCVAGVPGSCDSPILVDEDRLTTLTAGFDHALGLKTHLGIRGGWQHRGGTSGGTSDYDELWGSVQLSRDFY